MLGKWIVGGRQVTKLIDELADQLKSAAPQTRSPDFFFDLVSVMLAYLKEKVSGEPNPNFNELPQASVFSSIVLFSIEHLSEQDLKNQIVFYVMMRILHERIFSFVNAPHLKKMYAEELAAEKNSQVK